MSKSDNAELYHLTEQTLSALEIQRQPFDNKAAHFRFFVDSKVNGVLAALQESLEPENTLPVVIAPRGAGKTALLELLIEQTHGGVQYFLVEGNEQFNANNVFAGMLEAFQEPAPDDLQACLDALAVRLRQLEEQKLRAVILLDDAEQVPASELYKLVSGMLYMRNGSALPSFRIALTAAPSFEDSAARAIPEDTDLHEVLLPLPQLDLQGTESFITHHLQGAGYFEALPLDGTAIANIRHAANGLPGLTLSETTRVLNETFNDAPAPSTRIPVRPAGLGGLSGLSERLPDFVRDKRALALAAVACLAIGSSLFLGRDKAPEDSVAENAGNTRIISEPLQLPAPGEAPASSTPADPDAPPRLVLLSEKKALTPRAESAPNKAPTPPAPPKAEPVKPEPAGLPEPVVTVRPAPPVETKPAPAPKPAESTPAARESATETAAKTDDKPASNAASTALESPNWVLMQGADQFTIQMIASSSRDEVERFLKAHELNTPNSIFSFARGNETWFALIHGLYPSIEDAQAAIRQLPEAVRTRHPWIRQIGRIQESLKNRS
ncbi:AAA family ATPase [Granulosicoccaceae sp. 1_MG-2023]|nr:AAA family ATPase [Granulosicoccaceae sp. 1_MG-2023]